MALSREALEREVKRYLEWEPKEEHRRQIGSLLREAKWAELSQLVGKRLTFGTAGIRGRMGAGYSRMNELVIAQSSQGLASYLLEACQAEARSRGVIIGFDARHNSHRFAHLAALAFLQREIPVYLIDYICPTPLIAFGVRRYKCVAGVVVTASHNPKEDNGYKVYWSNGAQILSPHDQEIQRHICMDSNQKPWPLAFEEQLVSVRSSSASSPSPPANKEHERVLADWHAKRLIRRNYKDLTAGYYDYIDSMISEHRRRQNQEQRNLSITYTTMHGVGHPYLTRALDIAGFEEIFSVPLQKNPDPEFSTVKFPNPEESGALELAFETARHANSNLILANDPDADRCAAALFEPATGRRRLLTGNEIGALLGWWIWHSYKQLDEFWLEDSADEEARRANKPPGSDCYMISTAVSSKFLLSMARAEGFQFVETLTGFKYIGNVAETLIKERQKRVLFAYEEAIGYMCDARVLDKDGISAAVQLASCAAYVASAYNRTLEQQLDWLYSQYGYHYNLNSYFLCHEPQVISLIFSQLQSKYPLEFSQEFKVTRIRDLNRNYDSATENHQCTLPTSSSSFMVTFFVNDNITLTMRTSGTEPKIKYYSEIVESLPALRRQSAHSLQESPDARLYAEEQLRAKEAAREKLSRLVELAIERCLQPNRYNLEPAD